MELYKQVLHGVLEKPDLTDAEKMALSAVREQLGLEDFHHEEGLVELGWTVERFQNVIDHNQRLSQYRTILRECLIESALIQDREIINKFRIDHSITNTEHELCLKELGWSSEEFINCAPGGQTRAAVPTYQELLRRALADEYLSEAEDASIKAFRFKHGIAETEHAQALQNLGLTPEIYAAKRATHARKELKKLTKSNSELDSQIDFLTQKFAAQHKAGEIACKRLQSFESTTAELTKQADEVEDQLVALRKDMHRLDHRLTNIKDFIENKDEISRTTTTETLSLEKNVREKNAEVQELAKRIESLTSHMQEKQTAFGETSKQAERVLKVMQQGATALPKEFRVESEAKNQAERGQRMFRTATIAIKSTLLTREEAETIRIDVDSMYVEMKRRNLGIAEWKNFITEQVHQAKMAGANPDTRKAKPMPAIEQGVGAVEGNLGTHQLVSAIGLSPS